MMNPEQLESLSENVMRSVRLMDGGLVLLAGNVWGLQMAHHVVELAKSKMRSEGMNYVDVSMEFSNVSDERSLMIFGELRDQDDPEHSVQLATQVLKAGATVLAVVHGTNRETVQSNLTRLGMSSNIAATAKVIDFIVVGLDTPADA